MTEKLLVLAPGGLLLLLNYGNYWSSHWYTKWTMIVVVFSAVYAWMISLRTSLVLFPILLLTTLSASYLGVYQFNHFKTMPTIHFLSLSKGGLYSLLAVIMATQILAYLPRRFTPSVTGYLTLIPLFGSLQTLLMMSHPVNDRGGFSGNASMHACTLAALTPFVWQFNRYLVAPCLAAILLCGSSQGPGVVAVVVFCYAIARYRRAFYGVLCSALILCFGAVCSRDAFLGDAGRFYVWKPLFRWWWGHDMLWTGSGLGSGTTLFPYLQELTRHTQTGYFLWLHSDWLQILFEGGVVTFIFSLVAFGFLALKSFRRPVLFSSLVGFGASGAFNYPLRLPVSVTAVTLVCWLILQKGGHYRGSKKES